MLLFCANEKKFSFRWFEEQFVQVHLGKNVSVSVLRDRAEFVGVKEMYSWVSSAYKWYLREFFEITEPSHYF